MSNKVDEILMTYEGNDTDLCYYIFNTLNNSENPGYDLEYFIEKIRTQESNKTYSLEKKFSNYELAQLDSFYSKYIEGLLLVIVKKAHLSKWDKKKFYNFLWEKISTDSYFEKDKEKSFALFKVAQMPLMPYVELESPMSMSDEKFGEILEKNENSIIKIRHILSLDFMQKTETASLIVDEIQKGQSYEDKSVIMAVVLSLLEEIQDDVL